MKDWKGNIIEEGDEICFIQIKRGGMFYKAQLVFFDGTPSIDFHTEPESDCWEVGEYFKVKKYEFGLAFTEDFGDSKITMGIEGLNSSLDDRTLLAIKGKSDFK